MSESEFDETLCVIRECMVYKLPPRSKSSGYRVSEWDLMKPLWTGRMRLIARGEKVRINLEDARTGELFAVSPVGVEDQYQCVEPVLDSSRYFALRLLDENSGRHAFVGLGFNERSYSFDFKAALQDQLQRIQREKEFKNAPPKPLPQLGDLSLKQNISVGIGQTTQTAPARSRQSEAASDELLLNFALPPPSTSKPPVTTQQRPAVAVAPLPVQQPHQQQQQPIQTKTIGVNSDLLGIFSSPTPSSTTSSFPVTQPIYASPVQQQQPPPQQSDWTMQFASPIQTQPQWQQQPSQQQFHQQVQPQSQQIPFQTQTQQWPMWEQQSIGQQTIATQRPATLTSTPTTQTSDPFACLIQLPKSSSPSAMTSTPASKPTDDWGDFASSRNTGGFNL